MLLPMEDMRDPAKKIIRILSSIKTYFFFNPFLFLSFCIHLSQWSVINFFINKMLNVIYSYMISS